MMILAAFILLFASNWLNLNDIIELRKLYYKSFNDKKSSEQFFDVMKEMKDTSDPLLMAFKGMSYMMQAKHSFNPYTKLARFNKGKSLLDNAIRKSPQNVEARFMRFCVQTNAPAFLGYKDNIHSDKAIVINGWKKLTDKDLKEKIKIFMIKSSYVNDNERPTFQ